MKFATHTFPRRSESETLRPLRSVSVNAGSGSPGGREPLRDAPARTPPSPGAIAGVPPLPSWPAPERNALPERTVQAPAAMAAARTMTSPAHRRRVGPSEDVAVEIRDSIEGVTLRQIFHEGELYFPRVPPC